MRESQMLKAVMTNDTRYDGLFFYAVKSTGIFCRPSCKSRPPKEENMLFFYTANEAQQAGFRPCKRCRSDLAVYDPAKEAALKIRKFIEDKWTEKMMFVEELRRVGISQRTAAKLFKEAYGLTPNEYINELRLKEVKRLLEETTEKIIDIAYSGGFNSLSAFYRFFKSQTGQAPGAYRKEAQKRKQETKE